jgi:hypothetical protein
MGLIVMAMSSAEYAAEEAVVLLLGAGILEGMSLSSQEGKRLASCSLVRLLLSFVNLFLERFGFLLVRK